MLPAVWVLGTVISTGVAYAAVQMVSGTVVERQREPLTSTSLAGTVGSAPALPTFSPSPQPSPRPSQGPVATPTTAPPPRPPAPTPPPPQPATSTRTFTLVGGTAQLTCSESSVALNWATPNNGFWVETSTENGGATIEVRFRSSTHESRLDAWCASGSIQFNVREESS